jgi:hypothetical protein
MLVGDVAKRVARPGDMKSKAFVLVGAFAT